MVEALVPGMIDEVEPPCHSRLGRHAIFGAQLAGFVLLALGGCSAPAPAPGWSAPYSSGVGPKVDGDRGY